MLILLSFPQITQAHPIINSTSPFLHNLFPLVTTFMVSVILLMPTIIPVNNNATLSMLNHKQENWSNSITVCYQNIGRAFLSGNKWNDVKEKVAQFDVFCLSETNTNEAQCSPIQSIKDAFPNHTIHYVDCDDNGNGGMILLVKTYLNPRISIKKESGRCINVTLKDNDTKWKLCFIYGPLGKLSSWVTLTLP